MFFDASMVWCARMIQALNVEGTSYIVFCSAIHSRLEAVIKVIINKYTSNVPDDVATAIAWDLKSYVSVFWT